MPIYFNKEKNKRIDYQGPEYTEDGTNIPMSKGYRKVLKVVKDGQEKEITDDLLEAATAKGYKIKELAEAESKKTFSGTEAAARGFTQGATLGFADELAGGLAATKALFTPGKSLSEEYTKARDLRRQADKMSEAEQPGEYLTGEIVGSVASPSPIKGAGIGKVLTRGAVEGATAGLGSAEGDVLEQAKSTVTGAGIGAGFGAAAKGLETVGKKMFSGADKAVGSMGEGRATQFVEDPAKFRLAEEVPQRISEKKREFGELATGTKRQIKGDLVMAEKKAARKYETLKGALAKFDSPVDEANDAAAMGRTILADTKKNAFIDDESRKLLETIEKETTTSSGKPMMIPEIDPQSGKVIGMTRNPGLTEGESVELLIDLRQRLGELIEWGPKQGMSKTERLANKALKDSYFKLDNYTKELGTKMDPELRSVYEDANKSYSRYIRSKGDLEKIAGTPKLPSTGKRALSEKRIARTVESGAEDVQGALKEAAEGVSPEGARGLARMAENVESREGLKKLGDDAALLGKGGFSVPVKAIGQVGVTPLRAARAYTIVRDIFGKPALTAAVRALEVSGRPVTMEVVKALAGQHGVSEEQLTNTLREQGALKE